MNCVACELAGRDVVCSIQEKFGSKLPIRIQGYCRQSQQDPRRGKMKNYIDIHSHILPGIDDGSDNLEMSMEMLHMAVQDGISQIVLTPHNKPWRRRGSCSEVADGVALLQGKLAEEHLEIKLYPGNELYYRSGLIEELMEGRAGTLANSHYVLVEFEPSADYDYIRNGVYTLLAGGYYPILAHVERYKNICTKMARVAELIEMGCFIQVNAGSIMGEYGFAVSRLTKKLLKQGLVHFVATDTHDLCKRCPCLSECAVYVEKKYGEDSSKRLFLDNPMCVLRDEYIGMNT